MLRKYVHVLSGVGVAVLVVCGAAPVWAQASLGTAQPFAVMAGQQVTNSGATNITGDLGVYPGSAVTGGPTVVGTIHAADAVALSAQNSLVTQYNTLDAAACSTDLTGQDLGGLVLTQGVYCFSSSAQLTGTLTLNAQGNSGATFIFKTVSGLNTAVGSVVSLINGGNPCGVAWKIGSSATIGGSTSFIGNLIALTTITLGSNATILGGRALARNGDVTLLSNTISFAPCTLAGTPPPVPTLGTWAMIALGGLLAVAGFLTLRRRQSFTY